MIDVKNFNYTYPKSEQPALRGRNFAIQPGEIFGFPLGPKWGGQIDHPENPNWFVRWFSRSATIMGRPVTDWGSEYYEHIGRPFDSPIISSNLQHLENLRYFAALYSHRTLEPIDLLQAVGWKKTVTSRGAIFERHEEPSDCCTRAA